MVLVTSGTIAGRAKCYVKSDAEDRGAWRVTGEREWHRAPVIIGRVVSRHWIIIDIIDVIAGVRILHSQQTDTSLKNYSNHRTTHLSVFSVEHVCWRTCQLIWRLLYGSTSCCKRQ